MKNSNITLSELFRAKERLKEKAAELADTEKLKIFKEKLAEEAQNITIPDAFYQQLLEKMLEQVDQLLNIKVTDILVKTWGESEELQDEIKCEKPEEAEQDEDPDEEGKDIPLVEHTIVSQHKPSLKLKFGEKVDLGELTFTINVEFVVAGVVLKVKEGKITHLNIGSCTGEGEVKWGDLPLLQLEATFVELPDLIDLTQKEASEETQIETFEETQKESSEETHVVA